MKQFLQRLLGTHGIYDQINDMQVYITGLRGEISALKSIKTEIQIHNRALSRLIAKLDPLFAGDELSPQRKAESDKIADEVIRKLVAKHLASNPGES